MAAQDDSATGQAAVLDREDIEGVLSGAFYAPAAAKAGRKTEPDRPTHYKVICISMYTKDLDKLDGMVDALKKRGITKANRSALIRVALEQLDLDRVPRGM
jgi:hypothetical protein